MTYIDSVAGLAVEANSLNPTFPTIALPIAVIVLDGVNRIQQVIDQRPSYLSSTPKFATGLPVFAAAEDIADPTKRVNFQNNFYVPRPSALSPQIPQHVSLPSPGFFLGAGSIVATSGNFPINVINIPTRSRARRSPFNRPRGRLLRFSLPFPLPVLQYLGSRLKGL